MTQKLNNDQLRQLYFDGSTSPKSFRKHKQRFGADRLEQSFFDTNIKYEKFNANEIKRFEKVFERFVDPTPHNCTFKEPKTIPSTHTQVEKKIPSFKDISLESGSQFEPKEEKADIFEINTKVENKTPNNILEDAIPKPKTLEDVDFVKDSPIDHYKDIASHKDIDTEKDNDLIYLENLVTNGVASPEPSSLSDIFNEIVDNEKESISNYESSVFDANVQLLFDDTIEVEAKPISSVKIENPNLNVEVPSVSKVPQITEKVTPKHVVEPKNTKVPQKTSRKAVKGKKNKKKASKIGGILDTLLILIVLIIISIFLFNARDSLPFEVPF